MIPVTKEIVHHKGRPRAVPGVQIEDKRLIIEGRYITVARLRDEWYDDLGDPELVIRGLKTCARVPDLFTFWQRLPDTVPNYPYYRETEALSAIPLKDFQYWWEKQINSDTRKKAKRAEKRGIEIKVVSPDDAFVSGVIGIFNETPVRRGKPFWHYRKDFEAVKAMLSADQARSRFIGAYDNETLVGFVKLVFAERRFANPAFIVSTLDARKKYVNNALVAKSVELCVEAGVPYFTYTGWRRGSQAEFLMRHGFEKNLVPRYWIPLTSKGRASLALGLHRGIRTYIPDQLHAVLVELRALFYNTRHPKHRTRQQEAL